MQNVSTLIELIFKDKEENVNLWESLNDILQKNNKEIINFCNIIKNKINSGIKADILLAVNLVDFAVDFGKMVLWEQIDSKDFLKCIINIIQTNPDQELKSVCLYLINKLADKFGKFPSIQNCVNIHNSLKASNVNFPNSLKHSYRDILQSKYNGNNNMNNNVYEKLKKKLNEITQRIQQMNILIDKNENSKYNDNLKNLFTKLESDKNKLIELIQGQKLTDEKLMKKCIEIVDNINSTFERYKKPKKGENPVPFLPSFTRNNNPYNNQGKNKIDMNKTFTFGENPRKMKKKINLGNTLQNTVFLNDGENGKNIMENSLNVMFGKMEESKVLEPAKNINQNNNESMHFFNQMSQFSQNGDEFNNNINNKINNNANNKSFSDKNLNFLDNSNIMIIGNRIINNNINNNNNFANNSLVNQNFIEKQGSKEIFNNFLINKKNLPDNKTCINNNKHNNLHSNPNNNMHNNIYTTINNNKNNNINNIKHNNINNNFNNNMKNNMNNIQNINNNEHTNADNNKHKKINNNINNNIKNNINNINNNVPYIMNSNMPKNINNNANKNINNNMNNINNFQINNNYNNLYNTQMAFNNPNINANNQNNIKYNNNFNNHQNNGNNLSKTQFIINHNNFNNKK